MVVRFINELLLFELLRVLEYLRSQIDILEYADKIDSVVMHYLRDCRVDFLNLCKVLLSSDHCLGDS